MKLVTEIHGQDGRIVLWATGDEGQGVYWRMVSPVDDLCWHTYYDPPATPVFRSQWHFIRWVRRHCGTRGQIKLPARDAPQGQAGGKDETEAEPAERQS